MAVTDCQSCESGDWGGLLSPRRFSQAVGVHTLLVFVGDFSWGETRGPARTMSDLMRGASTRSLVNGPIAPVREFLEANGLMVLSENLCWASSIEDL